MVCFMRINYYKVNPEGLTFSYMKFCILFPNVVINRDYNKAKRILNWLQKRDINWKKNKYLVHILNPGKSEKKIVYVE